MGLKELLELYMGRGAGEAVEPAVLRQLPGGGLLIRDVAGDLYRLADAGSLDKKSRALLWALVD